MSMPSLKNDYDENGYVILDGLIAPEDFTPLEQACQRAISRTRSGEWKHRRTVGKQFPPYGEEDPDSWGVQHVMHPALGEDAFAKWYTSEPLTKVAAQLLDCRQEDLQMELFNLLINPLSHDFALRWHRDDVPGKATEEEEIQALGAWHYGIQWNTALYTDSCLFIVPKSHKIPRTAEQRSLSMTSEPPSNPLDMPGAFRVTLKPGQTVFYNSNIMHCATYDSKAPRATLHATMGDVRGGSSRARNVLQHGLEWMKEEKFNNGLNEKGQLMLHRLVEMQKGVNGDVGYSLVD
ncbi:hypothetical protein FIBSPDRAFT_794588 [Athelia psychrophila]|uniref:Phytanoyl-CoA dioxygenase n=1 Tax=Athelia psychrophila TaxID=1759441 RepID=A0A166F0U1_9AGAM|nr:hypothetical protein FIBSPDRAFT_794588 [Fibularhizoctonia sp. CBS 109695]